MRFLAHTAMRNLARRRARTALTFGMVSVGTALIVFMAGLSEGTYSELIDMATTSFTGHFEIVAGDYNGKPSLFKNIRDPDKVIKALGGGERVAAVTPRVETAGLLSFGKKTTGARLTGVDPAGERETTHMAGSVKKGVWLDGAEPGPKPVVLGLGLAKRLGAALGDEISFVGMAADGSIAAELFTVCGISISGATELDATNALVTLADADELLSLGGRAHRLVGRMRAIEDADLPQGGFALPEGLTYLSWREIMPALDRSIKVDRMEVRVIMGILIAVVILGVANTMMMVVMERTHELGVLGALGTPPGSIVMLVMLEAAWICLIATLTGIAAGGAANLIVGLHGIPLVEGPMEFGGVTMTEMHSKNDFFALVTAPFMVFVSGLAASLIPAVRAARLKPADALRKT